MGFIQRFERRLEGAVGNAFARVFGGKIVPAEVEDALQREADIAVREVDGYALAPNRYVLTVSQADLANLTADTDLGLKAFARHLDGYISDQGWQTYGDVAVELESSETLHTGQFRTHSSFDPDGGERPAPAVVPPREGAGSMPSQPPDPYHPDPARTGRPRPPEPGRDPRGHDAPASPDPYDEYDQYGRAPAPEAPAYDPRHDDRGGYPPAGYGRGAAPMDPPPGPPPSQRYGPPAGDPGYGYDRGQPQRPDPYRPEPRYPEPEPRYPDPGYGRPDPEHRGHQPAEQDPGAGGYADPGYRHGYQDQVYAQQPYPVAPEPRAGYGEPVYTPPVGYSVTLRLEDGSDRTYTLEHGSNIIGRGQDAHFRIPDTGVSRRHLDVQWDGSVALLVDLQSTNGTTVNGTPVSEWQLADRDAIRIGHSEIVVYVH